MTSGVGSVLVVIEIADTIVPLYDCVAVTLFASVASIVKLYEPATVGVPVIAPVAVSSDNPAGSDPNDTENAIGAVPPDVATVWLYDVLSSGTGSVAVVMLTAAAMVPLYACDAVTEFASVAVTVKLYAPAAVGVPLIADRKSVV